VFSTQADDYFEDDRIAGLRWNVVIVPAGAGTMTEANRRVEMRNSSPGSFYVGLQGRCVVAGDFDVQVDFALLNWPARSFDTIRLAAMDLSEGPVGHTGVYRNSFNAEDYQFRALPGIVASVPRSDMSGRLKVKRTGSTVEGFYGDGTQFVRIGTSVPTSTNATRFLVDFANGSTNSPAGVAVAFANFRVNAGTVSCP
jgi:hypothetical protein